jgi:hypothetical protein
MLYDFDTLLTTVYVMIDDFLKSSDYHMPISTGPRPSLDVSEVLTLSVVSHLPRFQSERAFWRFAVVKLRDAFPNLPHLSQFNRMRRHHVKILAHFVSELGNKLRLPSDLVEALDATAVPIRNVKRRGHSWLVDRAGYGYGHRIGWYFGFYLIAAAVPSGAITGFAFAPANVKDQPLASGFLRARAYNKNRHLSAAGLDNRQLGPAPSAGVPPPMPVPYLTDKGFEGKRYHNEWRVEYNATVITPPKADYRTKWPKAWHKFVAHHRQIIETAFGKLQGPLGLEQERPHDLTGFSARVTSRFALHNILIAINRSLGRQSLAFAGITEL